MQNAGASCYQLLCRNDFAICAILFKTCFTFGFTLFSCAYAVYVWLVKGCEIDIFDEQSIECPDSGKNKLHYILTLEFETSFDFGRIQESFESLMKECPVKLDYQFTQMKNLDSEIPKKFDLFVQVNTISEQKTVMKAYLPSSIWDGTSCGNFMREMINRYYGNDYINVFSPPNQLKGKDQLPKPQFAKFISKVISTSYTNVNSFFKLETYKKEHNLSKQVRKIYLSKEETKQMMMNIKSKNIKPFIHLVHTGNKSYKSLMGETLPKICVQTSLFTRFYHPTLNRNYVGDWLISPLFENPLNESETIELYEKICGMNKGLYPVEIEDAIQAKCYGVLHKGATVYAKPLTYVDYADMNINSLFFNNYGVFNWPEECKIKKYNWTATKKFAFHCITVNGQLNITISTTTLTEEQADNLAKLVKQNVQLY
jgi:hypothetical protein